MKNSISSLSTKSKQIKIYQSEMEEEIKILTHSFDQYFYFHLSQREDSFNFRFYFPSIEQEKDTKHFLEIDFYLSFYLEEEEFNECLALDSLGVTCAEFSAENHTIMAMMYGEEIKNIPELFPSYQKSLHKIMLRKNTKETDLLQYIEEINKEYIIPHLKKMNIVIDQQDYPLTKSSRKEIILDYTNIYQSLHNSIKNSALQGDSQITHSDLKNILKLKSYYEKRKVYTNLAEELGSNTRQKKIKI